MLILQLTDKQGYLIFKEDGSSIDIAGSKIKDFKNSSATFNSFITVVTHWLKYVNPKTPAEARKRHDSAQWIEAENIEMNNVCDMNVIKEMAKSLPKGVHYVHTSRFVYQLKLHTDGNIDKYKVRLVFRGFTQKKGVDYFNSYAPVTQIVSLKLFFFWSMALRLEFHHLDVKSAFLVPEIHEYIWMALPEGYLFNGNKYILLNKTLYGLVQAAYEWFIMFSQIMIEKFDFRRNPIEPCHLVKYDDSSNLFAMCLFHVDNVMTSTNKPNFITYIINAVKTQFSLTYAKSESVLGITVNYDLANKLVTFHQITYILKLVQVYEPDLSKVQPNPLRSGTESKYDKSKMGDAPSSKKPFLALLMSIYWIGCCTRPEVLCACVFFAHFSNCYTDELYTELLVILNYLYHTRGYTLVFNLSKYKYTS